MEIRRWLYHKVFKPLRLMPQRRWWEFVEKHSGDISRGTESLCPYKWPDVKIHLEGWAGKKKPDMTISQEWRGDHEAGTTSHFILHVYVDLNNPREDI